MKEIRIFDKEKFAEISQYTLVYAAIVSEDLQKMYEALHKQMAKSDLDLEEEEYETKFSLKLSDFLLTKYEAIVVKSDEQVFGVNGDSYEHLYDGTDTKVFLDAQF